MEESRFLLEMGKMFAAKKAKGTVWLTIKKRMDPFPVEATTVQHQASNAECTCSCE